MSATKWQHINEPATPVETDGRRIAREWYDSVQRIHPTVLTAAHVADLARRIDEHTRDSVREAVAARSERKHMYEELVGAQTALQSVARWHIDAIADRDALACATHRACTRNPGDCCAMGSVVGAWDARWTEIAQERDRVAGERDNLRAALLATRDHDEPDGPCWCPAGLSSEAGCRHTPRCRRARAALGIGQAVAPAPSPHPSCASADAPLGCEDCSPEPAP